MVFGGAGGGGAAGGPTPGNGGNGGGIIFINAAALTVTGGVATNGAKGGDGTGPANGGGSGAGGSILLRSQTATLGTTIVTATGGIGYENQMTFGVGGAGRIRIEYCDAFSGSTNPVASVQQLPSNQPPIAVNDSYTTNEDIALTVAAPGVLSNDTDTDGDPLTAILVSGPAHGSLTLNADGSFAYTPNPDFNGSDNFSYKANDGSADSNVATVTITVNPVNDPPIAVNDSYTTNEDTPLTIAAPGVLSNDTDADSDPLTALLVSGPAHGSLTLNANGSFTYTPAADFNGSDSFTYKANDGSADSNVAMVTITVNPVNDPPLANNDSATVDEDCSNNVIDVLANDSDPDSDPLTITAVSDPPNGTAAIVGNQVEYTPDPSFNGLDSFTYDISDGQGGSATATVNVTINPVNDPPVAADDSYATNEDTPLTIAAPGVLGNDSDADSDPLIAVLVSSPAHGSLSLNPDGSFSYTPAANFNGGDSFTYQANDGRADSNIATVTMNVNSVNDPPVAVNDSATVDKNSANNLIDVLANDSDPDGDPLAIILVSDPLHGAAAIVGNQVAYTPDSGYTGADSFAYSISDGHTAVTAMVNITVTASNGGGKGSKGNNGVGNGEDPQPPGNPPINDGPGTSPGNPGNKGGTPGNGHGNSNDHSDQGGDNGHHKGQNKS
jgi:VCBS repeat-containing protein